MSVLIEGDHSKKSPDQVIFEAIGIIKKAPAFCGAQGIQEGVSMSTEKGIVESTEDGLAWVMTRRNESCGHCGHKDQCHSVEGMDRMRVKVKNAVHARVGDEVELYLSTGTKLKGLFVLYMFPVFGVLLGAFSARRLSELVAVNPDVGMVVFTLSGLVLAVVLARFIAGRMAASQELMPIISRVLGRGDVGQSSIPTPVTGSTCCSPHGSGPTS